MIQSKWLRCLLNIDIEMRHVCGGAAKVIAYIEDLVVIKKILNHLDKKVPATETIRLPVSQAPPQAGLFG